MTKAIVRIAYTDFVVDLEEAVVITNILSTAQIYESKYHKDSPGRDTTHHIYDNDKNMEWTIKAIPEAFYNMAKLAGKPGDPIPF